MSHRFYLPQPLQSGEMAELTGPEAHHLMHVLRLKVGENVVVFDGEGREADARVDAISRSAVRLTVTNARTSWDCNESPLALCTAVPKGDRFDWLVEKATEVGVTRLVPLLTARSVVDPRSSKLERLRQVVVSAAKQCGRGQLMQLDEPIKFTDLWTSDVTQHAFIVADPAGESLDRVLSDLGADALSMRGIAVIVGPEGGLTDDEQQLADKHRARRFTLGHSILRIETAAIVAAGILRAANKSGR